MKNVFLFILKISILLSLTTLVNASRLAIVIGNQDYEEEKVGVLEKPCNDAKEVVKRLLALDFQLVNKSLQEDDICDFNSKEMGYIITDLKNEADKKNSELIFVFYSGHGLELPHKRQPNITTPHILPIDAGREGDIADRALDFKDELLDRLTSTKNIPILAVFDACRKIKEKKQESTGITINEKSPNSSKEQYNMRRLDPSEIPQKTMIGYSGESKKSVYEYGNEENSPYTTALLKVLDKGIEEKYQTPEIMRNGIRTDEVILQKKFDLPVFGYLEIKSLFEIEVTLHNKDSPKTPYEKTISPSKPWIKKLAPGHYILTQTDSGRKTKIDVPICMRKDKTCRVIHIIGKNKPTVPLFPKKNPSCQDGHMKNHPSDKGVCVEPHTRLEFVWIPDGEFCMGRPSESRNTTDICHFQPTENITGQQNTDQYHKPDNTHTQQTVSGFWMMRYEMSQEKWCQIKTGTHCLENTERGKHPKNKVSFPNIIQFIQQANKKANKDNDGLFMLPTAIQFEYATRAGDPSYFPWGNNPSATSACEAVNGLDRSSDYNNSSGAELKCSDGYSKSAPVHSFQPNSFGLYHMIGNVAEFTCSRETKDTTCDIHNELSKPIIRGGSWVSNYHYLAFSAQRYLRRITAKKVHVGFRLIIPRIP